MAVVLSALFVVMLWLAAVALAKDSRDGRDWCSRGGAVDRWPRPGD